VSVIPDRHRFRYKDKINALEKQLNQQQAKPVDDEEIVRYRTSLDELRQQIISKDADIARLQQSLRSNDIEERIVGEWKAQYDTAVEQAKETERGLQNQLTDVHQKLVEAQKDIQAGTQHLKVPLEKLFFLARRVHAMTIVNDQYPDSAKEMWSEVQKEWKEFANIGPNIDYISVTVQYIKVLLWKQFPAWDREDEWINRAGVEDEDGIWDEYVVDRDDDDEVNDILKEEQGQLSRKTSSNLSNSDTFNFTRTRTQIDHTACNTEIQQLKAQLDGIRTRSQKRIEELQAELSNAQTTARPATAPRVDHFAEIRRLRAAPFGWVRYVLTAPGRTQGTRCIVQ
jgi:chromosome segregation ATPase